MTNGTSTILKMIEGTCNNVRTTLKEGNITITATLDTTAPLKVLMENSISNWIHDERERFDEPEEYFERHKRYAIEEVQEYKDLLTALKGLIASYSEYEAIFVLEKGIELIIDR